MRLNGVLILKVLKENNGLIPLMKLLIGALMGFILKYSISLNIQVIRNVFQTKSFFSNLEFLTPLLALTLLQELDATNLYLIFQVHQYFLEIYLMLYVL